MNAEVAEKAKKFLEEIASHIEGASVCTNRGLCPYHLEVERDGITLIPLQVHQMETGSEWHRKPTGKLYFVIEGARLRNTKTYREREDGTLNPALYEDLEFAIAMDVRYQTMRNIEAINQGTAKLALEARNIKPYDSRIRAIRGTTPSFKVEFEITVDDLDRVLDFLDSLDPIYQEE